MHERTTPRERATSEAIADVRARLHDDHRDHGSHRSTAPPAAVTAVRRFGSGCTVLALGGSFDRDAVDELEQLLGELRRTAPTELVIDFSDLRDHHPRLGRVIGRARIRSVIDGVALTLHHLPPALADELDLPTDGPAAPVAPPRPGSASSLP